MKRAILPLAIAIVALAPFGEGGRTPLALLVLHTLALLALLSAGLQAIERGRIVLPQGAPRVIVGCLLLILVLAAASALRAGYPLAAALGLWDIVVACGTFLAALVSGSSDRDDLPALRAGLVLSTSLQAAIALLRRPHGVLASGAVFLNPNHLAAFLNLGLLICADRAADGLERGRRRSFRLWGVCALLHFAAIVVQMSRGALLGLLVSLALLVLIRIRRWPARARLAAAAGFIVAGILGGGLLLLRFDRAEDPYRYHRLPIWEASAAMLADRPLLGYGPGMFRHIAPRYNFPSEVGPFRYEKVFSGAHSGFLTFAAEDGAPAAALLILAAVASVAALWRTVEGEEGTEGRRGLALALLALLLQSLVDDLQERTALTLVPALLAGFALRVRCIREEAATPPRSVATPLKGAAALAAFYLFIVAVVLPYMADRDARAAVRAGREGLGLMERAARLNPLHPEYRKDLAMAVLNSGPPSPGRYARAATDLLEARRLKPIDPWYALLLGRLEAQAGAALFTDGTTARRAVDLYQEAARLAPTDPRPLFELAGYLASLKRFEEGLGASGEALRIEPNFVRARILEGSLLLRLGRRDEARESLRALDATRDLLTRHRAESGYARELAADDPAGRERLVAELGASAPAGGTPAER